MSRVVRSSPEPTYLTSDVEAIATSPTVVAMTAPIVTQHALLLACPLHRHVLSLRDARGLVATEGTRSRTYSQTQETEAHHFPVLIKPFDVCSSTQAAGTTAIKQEANVPDRTSGLLIIATAPADDMTDPPTPTLATGHHQDGHAPHPAAAWTAVTRNSSPGESQLAQWYRSPTRTDPFHSVNLDHHNITWLVRDEANSNSKPNHDVDGGTSSVGTSSNQEDAQNKHAAHAGGDWKTEPTREDVI